MSSDLEIFWTSPAWSQRAKLTATIVPLVVFFGLLTALAAPAACNASAGCTTSKIALPLGVSILLAVAGLAALLLPPA